MARRESARQRIWIGSRAPAPAAPEISLLVWIEEPAGTVLALEREEPEVGLAETLAALLSEREARPQRVRVSDEQLAVEARKVCAGIPVEVAPTPQVDALLERVAELNKERARVTEQGYLGEGRISPDSVAAFFVAAAELQAVAPWRWIDDDVPLRLDADEPALNAACVSIRGGSGGAAGFFLFGSMTEFESYVSPLDTDEAPDLGDDDRDDDEPDAPMLTLTFHPREDLDAVRANELAANGWVVAAATAVPVLWRRDEGWVETLLDDRDYRLATGVAHALAALFRDQPPPWDATRPVQAEAANGGGVIRILAPHDDWSQPRPVLAAAADGSLGIDFEERTRLSRLQTAHQERMNLVYDLVDEDDRLVEEMGMAARAFFARSESAPLAGPVGRFREWFVFDWTSVAVRGKPIEAVLDRVEGVEAQSPAHPLLQSVADVFAVEQVDAGNGFVARGLLRGRTFAIFDPPTSRAIAVGGVAVGRMWPIDDRFWVLSPHGVVVADTGATAEFESAFASLSPRERAAVDQRALEDLLSDDDVEDDLPRVDPSAPPPARNAPCPCGSGKWYKRCCGR